MQVLFYFYFLILPILFFRGFFDPFDFPRLLLTYSLVILVLPLFFLKQLRKGLTLRLTLPDLLVLLFLLFIGLSTLLAQDSQQAFWGNYPRASQSLLFYFALGIFYFLIRATFDTAEKIKEFIIFIVIGLGSAAIYGLFLYITGVLETCLPAGRSECLAVRVAGSESHPILFGALMMVGFFLSSTRLHEIKKINIRILTYIYIVIFLFGIVVSGSRGVFIAALAGLAIVLLDLRIRPAILLACYLVIPLGTSLLILLALRLPSTFDPNPSSSTNIRRLELQDALNLAKDKSFPFGIGASHLPFYYPQYRSPLHNLTNEWDQYPQQIRNNYLDILIAFGPFALISLLSCYLVILLMSYKSRVSSNTPTLHIFLLAAWIALLVHGLFYFYTTTTWVYFWTLTALLANMAGTKTVLRVRLKKIVVIPLFVGSLVLLVVGGRAIVQTLVAELAFVNGLKYYNSLSYIVQNQDESGNILFADYTATNQDKFRLFLATEQFSKAVKEVPYYNGLYERQYIHSMALFGHINQAEGSQQEAFEQASRVVDTKPQDFLNLKLRASIAFRMALDDIEKDKYLQIAIQDNQKLTQLDPTNPLNFDNLGLVLREGGKLDEARQAFEKSIELKGDRLPPYLHLAETFEWMGNKKEALSVYQKAFEVGQNKQNSLILEKIEKLGNN